MYAITCDLTGKTAYAGCACPDGHDPAQIGKHHDTCQLSDFHATVGCADKCCGQDHDHDPKVCTAEHPAGSCPNPADCKLWRNVRSHHEDPDADGLPADCPGGHHGYGVAGCVVCHPLTITFTPAEPVRLQRATA
jgi:hypothetical protein